MHSWHTCTLCVVTHSHGGLQLTTTKLMSTCGITVTLFVLQCVCVKHYLQLHTLTANLNGALLYHIAGKFPAIQ